VVPVDRQKTTENGVPKWRQQYQAKQISVLKKDTKSAPG